MLEQDLGTTKRMDGLFVGVLMFCSPSSPYIQPLWSTGKHSIPDQPQLILAYEGLLSHEEACQHGM